ncbi:hypothetical protein AU476_06415 [Cupriavidus sp. UYMSc13B]|nr:hypothetical protein AU476_06415 [Cupriavidus sp. UYMSc13B]
MRPRHSGAVAEAVQGRLLDNSSTWAASMMRDIVQAPRASKRTPSSASPPNRSRNRSIRASTSR